MKKTAKKLTALALSAALLTAPAGAITADGQSETWFDGVWSLIDAFSFYDDPLLCNFQHVHFRLLHFHLFYMNGRI